MPLWLNEIATTPDGAINRMRNIARNLAVQEYGGARFGGFQPRGSEYGFADLRPTHIRCPVSRAGNAYAYTTGFGQWTHGTLRGATAQDWYNTNVHEDAIVLLYGLFNNTASPTITDLRQLFGGEDLPLMNIQKLYGQWEPQGYFELGYVVGSKQPIRAQLLATGNTAALLEQIGYIGEVLARRRYVIVQSAPTP